MFPQVLTKSCPWKRTGWTSSSQSTKGTVGESWLFDIRSNVECEGPGGIQMKCPECGEYKFGHPGGNSDRWCPKCGTRMMTLPVRRSEDRQSHSSVQRRLGY